MSDASTGATASQEPQSGHSAAGTADPAPTRTRRLLRITQGQQMAGVCTGLAAYAEVRVDWVRTFFVLATVFSAGLFGLVYVALVFIMPVAHASEA